MDERIERLTGIEPGDSNEVCLAKVMIYLDESWDSTDDLSVIGLIKAGAEYANEVLSARED
jgi:hypothetical protein